MLMFTGRERWTKIAAIFVIAHCPLSNHRIRGKTSLGWEEGN